MLHVGEGDGGINTGGGEGDGIIGASILNFFFKSTLIYWIVTYVGIAIFIGLTAYNTQKLKIMAVGFKGQEETEKAVRASIIGALALYLDFINLLMCGFNTSQLCCVK